MVEKKVQHRFTRMFLELKVLPYKDRLLRLGLWSLEERRNRADLLEVFKMVKGFSAVSWTHFFTRSHTNITHGHSWKLQKNHSQSDTRLYFFSQRCINRWNNLSQEAVEAPSINSFKNHLDKIRRGKMDFFMDWRSSKSYGCTMSQDLQLLVSSINQVQPHLVNTRWVVVLINYTALVQASLA